MPTSTLTRRCLIWPDPFAGLRLSAALIVTFATRKSG
jgi:hypothetical protein